MAATPVPTPIPSSPPSGPSSEHLRKLYELRASYLRFATFCKARSAEIRLSRSSTGSDTSPTSPEESGDR